MRAQRYPRMLAWTAAAAILVTGCGAASDTDASTLTPEVTSQATATATPSPPGGDAATVSATARPKASAAGARSNSSSPAQGSLSAAEVTAGGSSAAAAVDAQVHAYDSPGGTKTHTFGNPTAIGAPLTFLVVSTDSEWVQVQLPLRPNGSTGWVPAAEVTVYEVDYALEVSTAKNTLDLYRDGILTESFSVSTGTGETPTPLGTYYLTELIAPTNRGYGPYAYGISAFSDVLNEFGGGPGQIGLHGTEDQASIGQAASHGCIRLSNEDITTLAALLPLGTPIVIT